MREIKFRAWDCALEQIVEWEYLRDTELFDDGFDSNRWALMQFTGLRDMNGTEIYEGDILKLSYGIPPTSDTVEVVWYSDYYLDMEDEKSITYCGWWFKNIRQNGCSAPAGLEYQNDIEIIGNIYENPELLKAASTRK